MSESKNPHAELSWAYANSSLVHYMVSAQQPWQCVIAELVRENQRLLDELVRLRMSRTPRYVILPPELGHFHTPTINPNTPQ